MVHRHFQEGCRLTLPQLLVWASKTEEVQQYFAKFKIGSIQIISSKEDELINKNKFILDEENTDGALAYRFPP